MKIAVHNPTGMPLYVGATMVPAGETRHFDEQDVPLHLRPADEAPSAQDEDPFNPLAALLEGTTREIVAALPDMSAEDIRQLEALEQLGQARKGVLSAIAEALLAVAASDPVNPVTPDPVNPVTPDPVNP